MLIAEHPQEATLPGRQFADWLAGCRRMSRPGTPCWASVGTQFGEAVQVQANALAEKSLPPLSVDVEHFTEAARIAYTQGCRGVVFRSHSRLDASDAATKRRAMALEAVNRKLQLIAPWIGGGDVTGDILSADGTTAACVLNVDRTRLIVPLDRQSEAAIQGQHATAAAGREKSGQSHGVKSTAACSFVVPGVPDSNQILLLTTSSLRPIQAQRVAGGARVTLDSIDAGFVVVAEDPQAILGLRQRTGRRWHGRRAAVSRHVQTSPEIVADTRHRLAGSRISSPAGDQLLAAANAGLLQAAAMLKASRGEQAPS